MFTDKKLNIYIPVMMFVFITALLPGLPGFWFDNHDCWEAWAHHIHINGLRNAYGSTTDYMPIYQYFLWVYGKLMGTEKAITDDIPFLRCITLAFDFLGIWVVYKWIDKKTTYYALIAICIMNVAYTYDTIIWGQMDGTLSALVFLAIYSGWKGNNLWSAIFMVLAFNFKVQAIVIVPVWGLLFINNYLINRNIKTIIYPVTSAIILQTLILIPFMMGQYSISSIYHIILNSFHKYPTISIRAANCWQWFFTGVRFDKLLYAPDSNILVAGITFKQAGLMLFFLSSFFALLPTIKLVLKNVKSGPKKKLSRELIWATGAMVYMLFYFFNTEMHERYCHPAFIFITALAFFTGDFIIYILFSIMYFLTLEFSMQFLKLNNYESMLFNLKILASINALIILYLARNIYKHYKISMQTE